MILAMILLVVTGVYAVGGIDAAYSQLEHVNAGYMNLFPSHLGTHTIIAPVLFILGWFFAGLAVVGQPHIMIRFMALNSTKNLWKARLYYYSWYIAFFLVTILVGLISRLIIQDTAGFDPELALPVMAVKMLPPALTGLVIAGLFAATMSTADSQILACTASITGDFRKKHITSYIINKISTILIALFALSIALVAHESVFTLVVFSWGAMGSAFMPIVTLYSLGARISERLSITMVVTGLSTAVLFRVFFAYTEVYEALPGILMGFTPYLGYKLLHCCRK